MWWWYVGLYQLVIPDLPLPHPLLPAGRLQHPHLQGDTEGQHHPRLFIQVLFWHIVIQVPNIWSSHLLSRYYSAISFVIQLLFRHIIFRYYSGTSLSRYYCRTSLSRYYCGTSLSRYYSGTSLSRYYSGIPLIIQLLLGHIIIQVLFNHFYPQFRHVAIEVLLRPFHLPNIDF
jgi:hypothetical protein